MSGLNPFRLSRKPEAIPVTTQFVDSSIFSPIGAPVQNENENTEVFGAPQNEIPNPAAAADTTATTTTTTMTPTSTTRDVDTTSVSSDGASTSDPFRQATYVSDNDGDGGNHHENRRDSALQPDSLSSAPPTTTNTSATTEGDTLHPKAAKRASRPLPVPPTGSRTANSSSTDISQLSTRSGTLNGKRTSTTDIDTRPLGSRSANKEKKPPPPPKNRHGKLINNPSQPAPSESKRFSFHDSSSEASFYTPSTPSQSSKPSVQVDYFSSVSNENPNPNHDPRATDTPKRSQSQHKRPPTPPLSRRHSQMRRSKSTLSSKANPNRMSLPVGSEGVKPSPPPSPGATSLTPSVQRRASKALSLQTDENALKSTFFQKDQNHSPLSATAEASPLSRTASVRRTMSGSSSAAAPPPPPPRRARHSNDSTRPTSHVQPKKAKEENTFQPSNANNILEDLTRLQKEVDDLRGRYESRQASH